MRLVETYSKALLEIMDDLICSGAQRVKPVNLERTLALITCRSSESDFAIRCFRILRLPQTKLSVTVNVISNMQQRMATEI